MPHVTEYKVDRTGWPAGPWDSEPDRIEWVHGGHPCLIVRSNLGNLCGYAAVNPGHPDYGRDSVDCAVHGVLNYSGGCRGVVCHIPAPGTPDDVWWFGFDCGHALDLVPHYALPQSAPLLWGIGETYKTVAYVRDNVEQLAEYLANRSNAQCQ